MKPHYCATIVIFGVTGDLSRKKLFPAIYKLAQDKVLDDFAIIGMSFSPVDIPALHAELKKYIKRIDERVWEGMIQRFTHLQMDFSDPGKYPLLKETIGREEKKHKLCGNRLFYLATLPEHFASITRNMKQAGLASSAAGWSRVVFEKPFGNDIASAKKLNRCIAEVFREEQVYRIDHYLGKELVQSISVLRFTNLVLEPLWNRKHIDHVQIILSEDFGVEKRGKFYEKQGAVRDVVQNHMLQLLALIAMEAPKHLTAQHIRDEKIKVLRSVQSDGLVLGQYAGYRQEMGVTPDSATETFAALKLAIANQRWKGVPFYLLAGKYLREKKTLVYIRFKDAPCLLFEGKCSFLSNELIIMIQPNEGFFLNVNTKTPGKMDIVPVKMDFCHSCVFGPNTPDAYENLLLDVIRGDQSVFIREDEVEESWKIVDKLLKKKHTVHPYAQGEIPQAAKEMMGKDNRAWII